MESRRQEKVNRLLQKELGDIFLKEGKRLLNNSFISVVRVRVSADLMYARVYLNVMKETDPATFCKNVNGFAKEIRNLLAAKIRKQMRRIPELEFFYDDSLDYAEKMDELFNKINKNTDKKDNRNKLD